MNLRPFVDVIYRDGVPFTKPEMHHSFISHIVPTYLTALAVCSAIAFIAGRIFG